jgi:hypothetical protein
VDTYTDDIDESPFEKAINDELFIYSEVGWSSIEDAPDSISLKTQRDKNAATWGQNPDIIYDETVAFVFIQVDAIMNLIQGIFPDANSMLDHYLDGTGTDYTIPMIDLYIRSSGARDQYHSYIAKLEDHIKSVLKDGDTLHIVSFVPFPAHENEWPSPMPCFVSSFDWFLALGAANGSFSVVASKTGDVYTISGTYYVTDVYDFDEGDTNMIMPTLPWLPDISNGNMYLLHSAGLAQSYFVYGESDFSYEFS